jgi:putative sulfotransferase
MRRRDDLVVLPLVPRAVACGAQHPGVSMTAPTFIVGTGRCGSTMLSDVLARHPDILSVSEFFTLVTDLGGRIEATFPDGDIDARAVHAIVCGAHPKQSLMHRHDVAMSEVLYRPGARFGADVPAILQTTLPHLSAEPEALFDEVSAFILAQPPAPIGQHYTRLFTWLAARLGKQRWVERSGGSLRIVRRLLDAFPDARFVHIVRDGRTTAMSMSKHHGFRMALVALQLTEILGCDPFESADRSWLADVPDELVPFLPEAFDAEAFRRYETLRSLLVRRDHRRLEDVVGAARRSRADAALRRLSRDAEAGDHAPDRLPRSRRRHVGR